MEDSFIVSQVLSGNTQAYRILVLRYQRLVFGYLRGIGLPDVLIEEVAQEAFFKAYQSLATFDGQKAKFSTWLIAIAKNLAINEFSRHSYKLEQSLESSSEADLPEVEESETPLSILEKSSLVANLRRHLSELPRPFGSALTLFHFNEMSLEEIASVENCSVGTVKSRIFRGKEMLKTAIRRDYQGDE